MIARIHDAKLEEQKGARKGAWNKSAASTYMMPVSGAKQNNTLPSSTPHSIDVP